MSGNWLVITPSRELFHSEYSTNLAYLPTASYLFKFTLSSRNKKKKETSRDISITMTFVLFLYRSILYYSKSNAMELGEIMPWSLAWFSSFKSLKLSVFLNRDPSRGCTPSKQAFCKRTSQRETDACSEGKWHHSGAQKKIHTKKLNMGRSFPALLLTCIQDYAMCQLLVRQMKNVDFASTGKWNRSFFASPPSFMGTFLQALV